MRAQQREQLPISADIVATARAVLHSTDGQEQIISRVGEKCRDDLRVSAALMYGSFAKGEGDEYSDVEFYVFVEDSALPSFDASTWVAEVAPHLAFFENEFGTQVAIFEDLLRGEFHFEPRSRVASVANWGSVEKHAAPDRMLLYDGVGELGRSLAAIQRKPLGGKHLQSLYDRFLNWFLLACNVLRRGERARALDALWYMHRFLLQLARAREGSIDHWLTPSRGLECDLPAATLARFAGCTADLSPRSLESALAACWLWSGELGAELDLDLRSSLRTEVEARFSEVANCSAP